MRWNVTLLLILALVLLVRPPARADLGFGDGDVHLRFPPTIPLGYGDSGAYAMNTVLGDVIRDRCVNVADLLTVRNDMGKMASQLVRPTDVNLDGIVNVADLLIVRNQLGKGPLPGGVCVH